MMRVITVDTMAAFVRCLRDAELTSGTIENYLRHVRGFNDLSSRCPDLAAKWYQPLNRDLTPETVSCGSQRKVAWKCGGCGCVWYARIDARTRKNDTGCPACAGQLNRAKIAYYGRIETEAPRRRKIAQTDNRAEL